MTIEEKIQKVLKSRYSENLIEHGYVYTGYYVGSGRHTKAVNDTEKVEKALKSAGVGYAVGNNAPRGGVTGNYIVLTSERILKGKPVARKLLREADLVVKAEKILTDKVLRQLVEESIKWCDPTDENDEEGRYWLAAYSGAGVYRLIVSGGCIRGSIYGGYHNSMRCKTGYKDPTLQQWCGMIEKVVYERYPDAAMPKADGSGCRFYLRDEEDKKLLENVKEYDVPSVYGGLHHNIEII